MALLSPGVEVIESSVGLTVATAGSSYACYAGVFSKGPADGAVLITSTQMLVDTFGTPTSTNYNDFYQCYNFLRYSGSLYVCRLVDRNGQTNKLDTTNTISTASLLGDLTVTVSSPTGFYVNEFIAIGTSTAVYQIASITGSVLTLTTALQAATTIADKVYNCIPSNNATVEVEKSAGTVITAINPTLTVANITEFDILKSSITVADTANTKLKFIAKNPGVWGNSIKIAIANPSDFTSGTAQAFPGIILNSLFQYTPVTGQVGIVIEYQGIVVETFTVSLSPTSKDFNQKSDYIENVLNTKSNYVFCKDNTSLADVKSKINADVLVMTLGNDGLPGKDEVILAYNDHFSDKELIDIDIVIANELANIELVDFATTRADCICYAGALYADVVGVKSTVAVSNLVTYVGSTGAFNISSSYGAFIGNYMQIYDRFNDTNRWVSMAGATAGLRAKASNDTNVWMSEAGLNRGQYKDVIKLAQQFSVGQRNLLYSNNINSVVSFPGLGVCLWGSRTTLKSPSVFSQINIRMLFNYCERAITNSSKFVVFEQNDSVQRSLMVSMIKPFLERIKAGRGLEEYLIVCDESNNTPIVRQNGQFICSIYLKPVNVVNFITLNFVAVGSTTSISTVVGA